MARTAKTETVLQRAIRKIEWGQHRGSWSTDLTSDECKSLYEYINKLTSKNDAADDRER